MAPNYPLAEFLQDALGHHLCPNFGRGLCTFLLDTISLLAISPISVFLTGRHEGTIPQEH